MRDDEMAREVVIVRRGEGRRYDMGRMRAEFFADTQETNGRYSISEWWLDPQTEGPGAHAHQDDHIFYILTGTLTLHIGGAREDVGPGSYVVIPGGVQHDFENHGLDECGFMTINIPAGFEGMMPQLVTFFAANPLGDV